MWPPLPPRTRTRLLAVGGTAAACALAAVLLRRRVAKAKAKQSAQQVALRKQVEEEKKSSLQATRRSRTGVDAKFLVRLRAVLAILFPRWNCRETYILAAHTGTSGGGGGARCGAMRRDARVPRLR